MAAFGSPCASQNARLCECASSDVQIADQKHADLSTASDPKHVKHGMGWQQVLSRECWVQLPSAIDMDSLRVEMHGGVPVFELESYICPILRDITHILQRRIVSFAALYSRRVSLHDMQKACCGRRSAMPDQGK